MINSPFPKSIIPTANLIVLDVQALPSDLQLMLGAFQGLVNREQPRLYLLFNEHEQRWPQRLLDRHLIDTIEETNDWKMVLNRFSELVRGLVITDPQFPVTVNVATMLAGVHNLVIVSPDLVAQLDSEWPVLFDLRGKWDSKVAAYQWAFDTLWADLRHDILAIRYPDSVRDRDYLVQFKIFTFWISGDVDGQQPGSSQKDETRFAEYLFTKVPANSPIMGYPYAGEGIGPGEGGGVALATQYGKYIVCDCPNLTVHSGVPAPEFKQRPPQQLKVDKSKVYLSFVISDGDNLNCWDAAHLPLWHCESRGQVPLGWNVMPGCYELIPDMLAYYYETASDGDNFIACGGGVGYANPYLYASKTADPERANREYIEQTAVYLQKLDIDILNPYHMGYEIDHQNIADFLPLAKGYDNAKQILQKYSNQIPFLKGILPDYARTPEMTYPMSHYLLPANDRQVPVVHAMTEHFWPSKGKEGDIAARAAEIRQLTEGIRPAFVHAFTVNWCFNPDDIAEVMRQLGPDYVAVRPDQLIDLVAQHLNLTTTNDSAAGMTLG
ncbi:MAG: hypothetical protein GY943_19990 [Chloroflexi bacterium]|nr:hypothetical protein [Chloroflexota bacterium]